MNGSPLAVTETSKRLGNLTIEVVEDSGWLSMRRDSGRRQTRPDVGTTLKGVRLAGAVAVLDQWNAQDQNGEAALIARPVHADDSAE